MLRLIIKLIRAFSATPKPRRRSTGYRASRVIYLRPAHKAARSGAPLPERRPSLVTSSTQVATTFPKSIPAYQAGDVLEGKAYVIDGDTIVIGGHHIRLAGIDAPELDQPYGESAKFAMADLCRGKTVTARFKDGMSYNRLVATCTLPDGTDVAAALVSQGLALDWAKFSGGIYRGLEPEGARQKLWRVQAKHRGQLFIKIVD